MIAPFFGTAKEEVVYEKASDFTLDIYSLHCVVLALSYIALLLIDEFCSQKLS